MSDLGSLCFTFWILKLFLVVGGLRYHGMAPLVSHVYEMGFMEAISLPQTECFRGN